MTATVDEWNERYRSAAESDHLRLWQSLPSPDLVSLAETLQRGTALDVATGDGRNAIWLAHNGWSVVGTDFSSAAVELAAARAESEGVSVEWATADARTWQPARRFDLITITYLQLPEPDLFGVISRAATWLSPRGHLILIGHDVSNLTTSAPGPTDREVLNTPQQLSHAADVAGLRVLLSESRKRFEPEHADDDGSKTAIDTILHATAADG
ncbi:MAG: class I SAM-dependent methyltransferase [Leifsonia sp.]